MTIIRVTCIECEGNVSFDEEPMLGEIAACPDCGVELEVISLDPIMVDVAPEVEEDWGE
jgi:alpha-aminoadipate/glutamate carrier protein LysW